jgi:hypothetical protein
MRTRFVSARAAASVLALGALALGSMGPARAFDFELNGGDIKGSLINLTTVGFSQRLRDQDPNLAALPGTNGYNTGFMDANMGDLNYKKGDLFALYLKGSNELLLKFPDKWKFFVRDELRVAAVGVTHAGRA